MKKALTIACAALAFAAPAQAQINHTGRYYGPNGSYAKCRVIGSQYSSSTYCISGEAARDEDRRLTAKNTCLKRLNDQFDASVPEAIELVRQATELEFPNAGGFKATDPLVRSRVAVMRNENAAYRAASKKCFTDNGFKG